MKNRFNSRSLIIAAVAFCAVAGVFFANGSSYASGEIAVQSQASNAAGARDDFNLPGRAEDMPKTGELFLRMILSVGIVCLLGLGVIYVSKRFLPRMTNMPAREIKVVASASLGNRKMVHLLEVGGKRILLGSTNDSMTKLAEFESVDEQLDEGNNLV